MLVHRLRRWPNISPTLGQCYAPVHRRHQSPARGYAYRRRQTFSASRRDSARAPAAYGRPVMAASPAS